MTFDQVRRAAPMTPACFTREDWVEYLHTAHINSKPKNQPFHVGVYRPAFSFCVDCTLEHSARMSRAGRCQPSSLRVILTSKRKEACTHE